MQRKWMFISFYNMYVSILKYERSIVILLEHNSCKLPIFIIGRHILHLYIFTVFFSLYFFNFSSYQRIFCFIKNVYVYFCALPFWFYKARENNRLVILNSKWISISFLLIMILRNSKNNLWLWSEENHFKNVLKLVCEFRYSKQILNNQSSRNHNSDRQTDGKKTLLNWKFILWSLTPESTL